MPVCLMGPSNSTCHWMLPLSPTRKTYVHLAQGTLNVNGEVLKAGDALKLEGENRLSLSHGQQAEVLVFDLGV